MFNYMSVHPARWWSGRRTQTLAGARNSDRNTGPMYRSQNLDASAARNVERDDHVDSPRNACCDAHAPQTLCAWQRYSYSCNFRELDITSAAALSSSEACGTVRGRSCSLYRRASAME